MYVSSHDRTCPKCDAVLSEQTDGSVLSRDIAHHGERIHEAMSKLDDLIELAKSDVTARLRIIVGTGLIREAACGRLSDYVFRQDIIKFEQDGKNRGVIIVHIRRG